MTTITANMDTEVTPVRIFPRGIVASPLWAPKHSTGLVVCKETWRLTSPQGVILEFPAGGTRPRPRLIHNVGYLASDRRCIVTTTSGRVIQYFEVPHDIGNEFRIASDRDYYWRHFIRDQYPSSRPMPATKPAPKPGRGRRKKK